MRLGAKWAIALLCILGALAAAAYRWPVRSATVEAEVNQTISPRLGLHLRRPANVTFALMPWPTLRVVGVELVDAEDRSVLSAPVAHFPLSVAGLFRGRLVPLGATLRSPTAFIDLDAAPAVAEARGQDEEPPALWSEVRLRGGVLRVVSAARHIDTLIESVDGTLDWPAADRRLRLALVGAWRDETVRIEGRIDNPRDGLEGRPTGLRLSLNARPLTMNVEGAWNGGASGGFSGDISLDIRSLSGLERLFGARPERLFANDSLSVNGKIQTKGAAITLSDSHFALAGQTFDGALTFSLQDQSRAISGTLAADTLHIDPLLPPTLPFVDGAGGWSSRPFDLAPPNDLNLDLRISVAHADWRGHRVDDAAASLLARDGQLTAKLLEATAYQGAAQGELTLAGSPAGLVARLSGSIAEADLGAALADFGWSAFRGHGGLEFSLRSTGDSPAALIASLEGTGSLNLQAGSVAGVNIEEAIRRSQRRPIDLPRDMTSGQTTFSRARAQFAIARGTVTIASGRVEGPGAVLAVEGSFDLAARALNTRLVATQADAQGLPSVDAPRLTIVLSGPWSAPVVEATPGG